MIESESGSGEFSSDSKIGVGFSKGAISNSSRSVSSVVVIPGVRAVKDYDEKMKSCGFEVRNLCSSNSTSLVIWTFCSKGMYTL